MGRAAPPNSRSCEEEAMAAIAPLDPPLVGGSDDRAPRRVVRDRAGRSTRRGGERPLPPGSPVDVRHRHRSRSDRRAVGIRRGDAIAAAAAVRDAAHRYRFGRRDRDGRRRSGQDAKEAERAARRGTARGGTIICPSTGRSRRRKRRRRSLAFFNQRGRTLAHTR